MGRSDQRHVKDEVQTREPARARPAWNQVSNKGPYHGSLNPANFVYSGVYKIPHPPQ